MSHSIESILQDRTSPSFSRTVRLVWCLSVPAILAQITSVIMQYIDAAMVGSLGPVPSAAIGVVSSSMWLVYGLSNSASCGFSVQVAQAVGEGDYDRARQIVRESLIFVFAFSLLFSAVAAFSAFRLPEFLGAEEGLRKDAGTYFFIFALSLPVMMTGHLCHSLLQASGNMKLPGFLCAFSCILDIVFNALFIYGLHLGIAGAALGTAFAEFIVGIISLICVLFLSPKLKLVKEGRWCLSSECLRCAAKIGIPMAFESAFFNSAYIASTKIIAPLGTTALAANSFGITAESLCYMPGYGISSAATTLAGQSYGAGRSDLAKKFSWCAVGLGMCIMTLTAVLMFFACPYVFSFFTPDQAVRTMGVKVLRIEVFAEPLFAASIICSGALRGAGDTLVPAIMNLSSMWGIRLTLMFFLCGRFGLTGAWVAMAIELCVRGILMLIRLSAQQWNKKLPDR